MKTVTLSETQARALLAHFERAIEADAGRDIRGVKHLSPNDIEQHDARQYWRCRRCTALIWLEIGDKPSKCECGGRLVFEPNDGTLARVISHVINSQLGA